MSEPMIIRARPRPGGAEVKILMSHEMETGQRKDTAGNVVPAWYITDVTFALNGTPVLTAQWGTAVAKNPFTQFTIKGAKPGDRITASWVDNRGDKRTDEAVVGDPNAAK